MATESATNTPSSNTDYPGASVGGLARDQLTDRSQKIVDHMIARMEQIGVEDEPYQNFDFDGCFPDDVYTELRANMPPRSCYLPINIKRWKNASGESTRDRLVLSGGEIAKMPVDMQQIWQDVTDALMSRDLQQAFYSKVVRDVAVRLGCAESEVLEQPSWPSVLLVRDFADYQLKPHPDGQPRVVTAMFYLADEGMPTDLGTSIYRRTAMLDKLRGKRFEEVKRFPFLPNSVGTFAVNDKKERMSLHGRELISGAEIVRDSIIVAWLSKESEDFGKKHNK